jgi:hypothetical protein
MDATLQQRLILVKEARFSLPVCQLATDRPIAAVLVWIYGGGYTLGSKSGSGSPATLLASARKNNQEGVIFVAMNYRLGLYVSLISPRLMVSIEPSIGLALWTHISGRCHCKSGFVRPKTCSRMGTKIYSSFWRRQESCDRHRRVCWWRFNHASNYCLWWTEAKDSFPTSNYAESWFLTSK